MREFINLIESAQEGSPADLLTDEFYDAMQQSGLSGHVEVSLGETDDRTVDLISIRALRREQGNGSKAMTLLCDLADKYGVVLTLSPAADSDELERLVDWYHGFGFDGGYNRMKRRPTNNLVENAQATGREVSGEKLVHRYGGAIMPFAKLPNAAKKALRQWMVIEGDNQEYQEESYGFVEVPLADLLRIIYDQNGEGMTFDEFWRYTKQVPGYRVDSVWPMIWSPSGWEDGMNRLGRYIQAGMTMIPVVTSI